MPGANFQGAQFYSAGLAEVEWEGADLRGADFRKVAFHLGSSRSGLVGSSIASERSRTWFYTDDFTDQDFKSLRKSVRRIFERSISEGHSSRA